MGIELWVRDLLGKDKELGYGDLAAEDSAHWFIVSDRGDPRSFLRRSIKFLEISGRPLGGSGEALEALGCFRLVSNKLFVCS